MSDVKYSKLHEFGTIHMDKKHVVVTLQESVSMKDGKEVRYKYISFHEHFKNDNGDLIPRRLDSGKVISFTMKIDKLALKEMKEIVEDILKYIDQKPRPAGR